MIRAAETLGARLAWLLLGVAMAIAAAVVLHAGRDLSFTGDELYYFGRLVDDAGGLVRYDAAGAEYLLAPHNGHLQLVGKLIYEGVFAVAGPDYVVLRLILLAGILLCVGLVFALARPRVGVAPALAGCVVVLFLGAAWEGMLWAFNLHTVYALAAGLAALLVLDRGARGADAAACVLLLVSVTTIELGLAFVAGVALLIAAGPGRLSRAWVALVPLAFYGIWFTWARRFDQGELVLSNLAGLPGSMFDSLTAVLASITGAFETFPEAFPSLVSPTWPATVLAAVALVALAAALTGGGSRKRAAPWLGALVVYWAFIGLADRPPDSSRYMLVGASLLLLTAAAALPKRWRTGAAAALAIAFVISLPNGQAKLSDGRDSQLQDSRASRSQYAMLELAREHVSPAYRPASEPLVQAAGPVPYSGLDAGTYLAAADRVGSLAYSLAEVRALDEQFRRGADATLAGALALGLEPASPPSGRAACGALDAGESADLPRGAAILGPAADSETEPGLGRFFDSGPSFTLGTIAAGDWARLQIPPDVAAQPWRLYADGPLRICSRR